MFPSGPFRSPNRHLLLHAPRHPAYFSRRIPLISAATRHFALSAHRGVCLTPVFLLNRSSSSVKQFPVHRGSLVVSRSRSFSISAANMTGSKIDGTAIAKDIREKLKTEIAELQTKNPRFKPNLIIYQGMFAVLVAAGSDQSFANSNTVGDRSDSSA